MIKHKIGPQRLSGTDLTLELIINASPVGIVMLDSDARIVFANTLAERLFGVSADGMQGLRLGDFIACANRRSDPQGCGHTRNCPACPFHLGLQSILEGTQDVSLIEGETLVTREPGMPELMVRYKASKIMMAGCDVVVMAFDDITERHRAVQALRGMEDSFRRIFRVNAIPLTISSVLEGRYVDVNDAFERLSGYTRQEVIGKTAEEIGVWADKGDRNRLARLMAAEGRVDNAEVAVKTKTGDLKTVLLSAVYMDFDGQKCFIGSILDITKRKKTEEALRESEERFHKAFMTSPAPFVISEIADGRFIDVNEQWERMLGYARAEQIGRTSKELNIWADPKDRDRIVQKLLDHGHFKDEPVKYIDKSGQSIFALWSAESVSLGGRQVMLSLLYDETERKKYEKEQAKLQKQLLQAQKLETVGRLAGGVAHDYNNMLTIITGYSELAMAKVPIDDPIHSDLWEILKAAKRSTEITQQLLAFARKQSIAPKVLDLNEAIENMLKMLRRLIGEDIDLQWHPESKLWLVLLDLTQVNQILANLCVNARDAVSGSGKISIATGNVTFAETNDTVQGDFPAGDYVFLSVSDDGCGMNEEELGNLFEPFFTTKEIGQGTGLGLATVYGIVRQNKGFIKVDSKVGEGSTIRVFLPRHTGKTVQKKTVSTVTTPLGDRETVLLVEDEPMIMRLAQTMLQELGYTVIAAAKPSQALEIAKELPGDIDLLVTDVIMPEMDGRALSNRIRKMHSGLKVLFMSGYTANIVVQHGVLGKGMYFIQKPFSLDELAKKIKGILGRE